MKQVVNNRIDYYIAYLQGKQDGELYNYFKNVETEFEKMHKNEQFENKEVNELPKKIKLKYGQGSITFRTSENRYMARYYYNGILQKPIYAKTQAEIIRKLKTAVNNKGKIKEVKKITTLKEWLLKWIELYKKPILAKSSYTGYEICINNHIVPKLGHYDINKLDSNIIQSALNCIDYPRQKEICYNILNESLRKALLTKITNNDYMIAVQKQKANSKKGKAFTTAEQTEFIKALNNFPNYKNVFLAYLYTGCRLRELLNIKWEDVNFENDLIKINGTKTAKALRVIPLNAKLKKLLLKEKKEKEFVFNFKADTLSNKMSEICKTVNINGFTVHSLRHTFATRCLENNIPAKVVQQWLGHSKINITLDIYTHVQTEFEKKQSKKINDIF